MSRNTGALQLLLEHKIIRNRKGLEQFCESSELCQFISLEKGSPSLDYVRYLIENKIITTLGNLETLLTRQEVNSDGETITKRAYLESPDSPRAQQNMMQLLIEPQKKDEAESEETPNDPIMEADWENFSALYEDPLIRWFLQNKNSALLQNLIQDGAVTSVETLRAYAELIFKRPEW